MTLPKKPRGAETAGIGAAIMIGIAVLAAPLLITLAGLRAGWRWLKRRETVSRLFPTGGTNRRPRQ